MKINIEKTITSSKEIIHVSGVLDRARTAVGNIKLDGLIEAKYREHIDQSLMRVMNNLADEAVYMKSLGDALEMIAQKYLETEKKLLKSPESRVVASYRNVQKAFDGNKNDWSQLFQMVWLWIKQKDTEGRESTTIELEWAADRAIKRKLWSVLQDEKYSQRNWEKSSVEERKQILQDYLSDAIKVYELDNVNQSILWESHADSEDGVLMGRYFPDSHQIALNEQVLLDKSTKGNSYELVGTVGHELRHAYQCESIDNPQKFMVSEETIAAWKKNFMADDYIEYKDDLNGYQTQVIEADASEFEIQRNGRY